MKRFCISILCIFLGASLCAGEKNAILEDKSFNEALTSCFSEEMYWSPFIFLPPVFEEGGAMEKDRRLPPSMLGKTVCGKVSRYGNIYYVDFGKSLPEDFACLSVERGPEGKWGAAHFAERQKNEAEVITENYKFKIPVDFTASAAKFEGDVEPVVEALKSALARLLSETKEAPAGENHFFAGPFKTSDLPYGIVLYWVERKSILRPRPLSESKSMGEWDCADFDEESLVYSDTGMFSACKDFQDDPQTQLEKRAVAMRLSNSSLLVANCVRDGKMLTVVKRPPSAWSKFKAWLKAKFSHNNSTGDAK